MVTDETGRHVHIAGAPQRIVSLAPGITETLYALGLDSMIAGVTSYCNWPAGALRKPRIGGFTNPSIEKIVSLKPDLIIATVDGNRKETVTQLERIGLPVYVINPSSTYRILEGIMKGVPDIILFAPIAHDREFAAVKKFWREFQQIPAVQNNRIYPIDTDLISRASPRLFDAIETMALLFHPDITIRQRGL